MIAGLAEVSGLGPAATRWSGYGRVRYRSLVKNALQLRLLAVALNRRRALMPSG